MARREESPAIFRGNIRKEKLKKKVVLVLTDITGRPLKSSRVTAAFSAKKLPLKVFKLFQVGHSRGLCLAPGSGSGSDSGSGSGAWD